MIGVHQNRSGHLAGVLPGEYMDASITEPSTITADLPVKPQRRRYSLAFKRQVIAEVLAGQESVSVVARRHDINANLLFKWKKLHIADGMNTDQQPRLLAIQVQVTEKPRARVHGPMPPGRIEIVLGADRWITVHGEVSRNALQTALEVLTR